MEISRQEPLFSSNPEDSIRQLPCFNPEKTYEKKIPSTNLADKLSFDYFCLETDVAHGMIFKGNRTGIINHFPMDVDLGFKYIEKSEELNNGI